MDARDWYFRFEKFLNDFDEANMPGPHPDNDHLWNKRPEGMNKVTLKEWVISNHD